jgi:glycosyltransferase involved in cell wall biosynthesis
MGFWLAKKYKIPLQIQIHTDIFSPWYRRGSWKERVRFWLSLFLIPRADCLRVVSERIKKSIGIKFKNHNLKIAVLPIFTDINKFLNATPNSKTEERFKDYSFKMISVGRLVDKEKNFSMLIEVMKDFIKICPRALLVIVGEGPDKEYYNSKIKNYQLEKNIIIEPWREDLPPFYRSFDLFLMSSNYEGWGRVVIEAMASGLPIVMTNVGLANEFVKNKENAIITPVNDVKCFMKSLINLYKNTALRNEIGRNNSKFIGSIGQEEYFESYINIMERCLIKKI